MNVLVCVSHVPDTTTKITFTNNDTEFNTNGVQFIVNPYDEIALSKAVELAAQGAKITVITVGDASTDPTIRKALAVGADQAVRIDAKPRDAWYVANQIANYAKDKSFDLILAGRESIDYNGAQVPALVGELLDIPSVSVAKKVEIADGEATIDREIEGGKEVLAIKLPVVIGVAEGVAEAKIPNMRGIMSARTKPLEVVAAVEVSEKSSISKFEKPEPRGAVTLVQEVDELVNLLHSKAKVI